MGVLGNLTDEYFGNKVREEDVVFRYDIDHDNPPEHTLTQKEEAFMRDLARHMLFFDKSLFFQIEDLQRHTRLVLSGKQVQREETTDGMGLEHDLQVLEMLIEENEKESKKSEPTSDEVLDILREQRKRLKDTLDGPARKKTPGKHLGEFVHRDNDDHKVILYLDVIKEAAKKDPDDTLSLMGQVLLHEYFHSFYFHTGNGYMNSIGCVEEPLTEYGSLVLLDSVASSGLSIAEDASKALKYALGFVKNKQTDVGSTAAYGFGAYLFEQHKTDYRDLIAKYAIASRLMDSCERPWMEFKYMLYPKYPSSRATEDFIYKKLIELLLQ